MDQCFNVLYTQIGNFHGKQWNIQQDVHVRHGQATNRKGLRSSRIHRFSQCFVMDDHPYRRDHHAAQRVNRNIYIYMYICIHIYIYVYIYIYKHHIVMVKSCSIIAPGDDWLVSTVARESKSNAAHSSNQNGCDFWFCCWRTRSSQLRNFQTTDSAWPDKVSAALEATSKAPASCASQILQAPMDGLGLYHTLPYITIL